MNKPVSILFVCHGNICRSPMAEFLMKDLVRQIPEGNLFRIASAATSTEELGNGVYPPVRQLLAERGIRTDGKYARQLRKEDYEQWDLLIGMDHANIRNMTRICGGDPDDRIRLLMEFAGKRDMEVKDPWYTGNFRTVCEEILEGCRGLLEFCLAE